MSYNSKQLKVQSSAKKLPKPKDVIYDPMGQWKFPGQITKIPSGNITMQGVPYPVLGKDNLGNEIMMQTDKNYQFPGTSVTEYPQFQKGGDYNMLGYAMHHPIGALKHFINPEKYHATDEYKKPNHITFSDESKYSNQEHKGGHWEKQNNGTWTFTPSSWNIKNAEGYDKLQDWWSQNEGKSGNILLPPSDDPQIKLGGWLNSYKEEYKKGGQKGLKKFTSKNIQTSLNDIMQRNTTLFGSSGKKRYKPDLNYKYGGWLDQYQGGNQVNTSNWKQSSLDSLSAYKQGQKLIRETIGNNPDDLREAKKRIINLPLNTRNHFPKVNNIQVNSMLIGPDIVFMNKKPVGVQKPIEQPPIVPPFVIPAPVAVPKVQTEYEIRENNFGPPIKYKINRDTKQYYPITDIPKNTKPEDITTIPFVNEMKKYGGWLDQYQTKGQTGTEWKLGPVSQSDSVRNMAGNQMRYEHSRGSGSGTGLDNYGNPDLAKKLGRNPTEQEAVDDYMQNIYPQVKDKYPTAMEQVIAGDLRYNAGKEAYNYLNWDNRKNPVVSQQNWDKTKITLTEDARRKALNNARDKYYKNTSPLDYTDPKTGEVITYNYGRDAQGEMIKDKYGAWSPAYKNTWYGRQNASDQYVPYTEQDFTNKNNDLFYKKQYGGKLNSYQNKGQVNTSNWKQSSLDSLNLYNRGNEMAKWGKENPNFTAIEHNKKDDELNIKYPVSSMPWSGKNSFIGATNWATLNSTKSGYWGVPLYDKPVGVQKKPKPVVPVIISPVTPAPVTSKPVVTPTPNTKFQIQETNFGPPIQYQYNPTTKQYVPITDIPKNTSKSDITNIPWVNGIKKYGGWLDQYQDGSQTKANPLLIQAFQQSLANQKINEQKAIDAKNQEIKNNPLGIKTLTTARDNTNVVPIRQQTTLSNIEADKKRNEADRLLKQQKKTQGTLKETPKEINPNEAWRLAASNYQGHDKEEMNRIINSSKTVEGLGALAGVTGGGLHALASIPAVANTLGLGFAAHGVYSLPSTYRTLVDPNESVYNKARALTYNAADFVGMKQAAEALKGVGTAGKWAYNNAAKSVALSKESGLLSRAHELNPYAINLNNANKGTKLNLENLRKVYHNGERFLQQEESRFLHKHGHGLREDYLTDIPSGGWGTDQWNVNNQLAPPPSEIQFMPNGTTRTVYNQQPLVNNTFDLNKLKKPINKSGLTKEEVLQKASAKDKDVISKMSDTDFENSVLKPTGEIVPYYQGSLEPQFSGSQNVTALSPKQYTDEFNSKIDLLNDIIAKNNKSGVEYRVKGLDESGILTFNTPEQTITKKLTTKQQENLDWFNRDSENFAINKGGLKKEGDVWKFSDDVDDSVFNSKEDAIKYLKNQIEKEIGPQIISGESVWSTRLNPGQWEGNVEDIANTEYLRSIPGLEMSNTSSGVFADLVPRKGTSAYKSINEYLKKLNLGRVKAGFNSQTEFSRGAWENFIKTGRGVGFYANPKTIYGSMKSIFPYIGIGGAGALGTDALLQKKYGGWLDQYQTGSETNTNTVNNAKENLTSYNKNTDTYSAVAPLKEVNITEESPQWIRDKNTKPHDKVNWWETLNYKKWGLTDYSDYSSFNSAFRNSKENNESEFMYKGKRYNTNLISKDQSDLYNESKQFLNNYYETQNYKPINFNEYGDWDSYIKEKTGTDWLEYYNSIKDSPEFTNIDYNNPESIKKFNAISDKLDELSSTDYDRNTGKEINKKLNNKEYEEYVIQKNKKIELNNLNDKSYYFSITDQKPKDMEEDGYLDPTDPKNKKIFLTTNKNKEGEKNKLNTTYIHELSHKADDYSVYDRIPKIDIELINKHKSVYPTMSQETFDYLSRPSEIEARKMSLLFYNHKNKIDLINFTDNDFQKYYEKNYDKFPYDIKQLFDLYFFQREDLLKYLKNDFSYLNNKKQYGGNSNIWLNTYQTGGPKVTAITSEADYNKRLLLPNKSKEEDAALNAWASKKNSTNKVVPYSWSPSGPSGPVKDVTSATPTYRGIDVSEHAIHNVINERAIEQSKLRKEETNKQARKDKIMYDQSVGEHGSILGPINYAFKKGEDWANSTKPGGGYETAGKALEFAAMSAMPLFEGVGLLKKPITTAAKWAFNNAARSVASNTAKSVVKPVAKTVAKSVTKPHKGFGEGLFNKQTMLTQEELLAQQEAFYESQNNLVNASKQTLNKILTQPLLPKVGSNSIAKSQGFYNNFADNFNINNILRESSKMSAPFSLRDSYTGFKDIYDTEGDVNPLKYFAPTLDAAFAAFPFTRIKGSSISNLIESPVTNLIANKNSIVPAVNYFVAKMTGKKAKGIVKDFSKDEVETLTKNDNKKVIQKKYGGNNQKSIKKAVNYNRSSKFVNSQDSNWLNKYQ